MVWQGPRFSRKKHFVEMEDWVWTCWLYCQPPCIWCGILHKACECVCITLSHSPTHTLIIPRASISLERDQGLFGIMQECWAEFDCSLQSIDKLPMKKNPRGSLMRKRHDTLAEHLFCMQKAQGSIPGNSSWKDQRVADSKGSVCLSCGWAALPGWEGSTGRPKAWLTRRLHTFI